ncbi:periplasmic binding protein-like I [Obelidium mucronatum]|nr:periplasmic binding protein-like I [Obelidium mucronatum]
METLNYSQLLNFRDDGTVFAWNDLGATIAIQELNNNPNILPNTTIKIKRFNNHRKGKDNPGFAMVEGINNIYENHPDVIAIHGDLYSAVTDYTAALATYLKLPFCGSAQFSFSLVSRTKYSYFFQTKALVGASDAALLLLNMWNVKNIILISRPARADRIKAKLLAGHIRLTTVTLPTKSTLSDGDVDFIASQIGISGANYILIMAEPATIGQIYFRLAKQKQYVGPKYVWMSPNNLPKVGENASEVYGERYYQYARGFITYKGGWKHDESFYNLSSKVLDTINARVNRTGSLTNRIELDDMANVNTFGSYDCINVLAHGFQQTMTSQNASAWKLQSRSLQRYLTRSAFNSTGYNGLMAHPLELRPTGDLYAPFFVSYLDGVDASLKAVPFAVTSIDSLEIRLLPGQGPVFFDGTSTPPRDELLSIVRVESILQHFEPAGLLVATLALLGITACTLISILTMKYRDNTVIRAGSPIFMVIIASGCILSYMSVFAFMGVLTPMKCKLQIWLQVIALSLVVGSLFAKNIRVWLIYKTRRRLKKYLLHDWVWLVVFGVLLFIECVLLTVWTVLLKVSVLAVPLGDSVMSYKCHIQEFTAPLKQQQQQQQQHHQQQHSDSNDQVVRLIQYSLYFYNGLLFLAMNVIGVLTRNAATTHNESSFIFMISILILLGGIVLKSIADGDQHSLGFILTHVLIVWFLTSALVVSLFGSKAAAVLIQIRNERKVRNLVALKQPHVFKMPSTILKMVQSSSFTSGNTLGRAANRSGNSLGKKAVSDGEIKPRERLKTGSASHLSAVYTMSHGNQLALKKYQFVQPHMIQVVDGVVTVRSNVEIIDLGVQIVCICPNSLLESQFWYRNKMFLTNLGHRVILQIPSAQASFVVERDFSIVVIETLPRMTLQCGHGILKKTNSSMSTEKEATNPYTIVQPDVRIHFDFQNVTALQEFQTLFTQSLLGIIQRNEQ